MEQQSHLRENGMQWAWDATSLTAAMTCPRKYQYTMLQHWEPARKSHHLVFGGHYATALERFYKYRAEGLDKDEALENVIMQALTDTWEYILDADGIFIAGSGQAWDSMDTAKNRETLIRTIVWYIDQFENDGLKTLILESGKPAVELSFTLDLERGYVLVGHLDRVVEANIDLYILDQKTTGSIISPRFFEGFSPDIQMSTYTFAGQAILHKPIRGVIVDGAQIAVGFSRFERGFVHRTSAQLDEWFENILGLIGQFEVYADYGKYPMNTTACGNYGGCPFQKICSKDATNREAFLRADFVKRKPWNPLIRR